jgi:PAT family beta-lactamase induction signal transducer AmpG
MTKGSWYKSITLLLFLIISCGYVVHNSATILFYKMLDTTTRQGFSHIKNTSHILGKLMTAGVLVMLVGGLETLSGKIAQSWSILFMILCGLFYAVLVYHVFTLPFGSQVREQMEYSTIKDRILTKKESLLASFKELTCQPKANTFLTFFLLYSIPHTFLLAITPLFLLDTPSHGGAGLSTQELGLCYGTIGLLGLTAGNIIGLKAIKEKRLENVIKTMSLCLSFPCLGYLLISLVGIEKFPLISAFVFLVEFGYGYGFTACTTFMERFCKGKPQYRVWCNIYITIGFILPGFITGYLQETLGYPIFFIIVIALGAISWSVTNNAIDSSR